MLMVCARSKWLFTVLFVPSLLANAPNPAPASNPDIVKARSILEDMLVDYSHARLRGFHKVRNNASVALCGQINAPNSSGGMTGWHDVGIALEGRYAGQLVNRVVPADDAPKPRNISELAAAMSAMMPWMASCDPTGSGTVTEDTDLTPLLQPVAN